PSPQERARHAGAALLLLGPVQLSPGALPDGDPLVATAHRAALTRMSPRGGLLRIWQQTHPGVGNAREESLNGEEDTGGGAVAGLTLVASDGFPVSATRLKATGPARGVMLVAPGIGFRQSYYADFAGHFAPRGWDVLTWDWRGTGSSRHGVSPRDPRLDLARWATEDLAAAIAWADRRSAGSRVILVGHSFGGHAVGLSHN